MSWPVIGILLLAVVAFDRLMVWLQGRGHVNWRGGSSGRSIASGMLSVHAILEPDKTHVVEEIQRQEGEIDVAGDDAPP